MNRLANALTHALAAKGLSQREFGLKVGLASSVVTLIVQGRRPSPEILKKLFSNWSEPAVTESLLDAHLRDEAERAGYSPAAIGIKFDRAALGLNPRVEEVLELLRAEMTASPEYLESLALQTSYMATKHHRNTPKGGIASKKRQEPLEGSASRDLR